MVRPIHELWKRKHEGSQVWLMEVTAGRVTGCYGPINERELDMVVLNGLQWERNVELLRGLSRRCDEFLRRPYAA